MVYIVLEVKPKIGRWRANSTHIKEELFAARFTFNLNGACEVVYKILCQAKLVLESILAFLSLEIKGKMCTDDITFLV